MFFFTTKAPRAYTETAYPDGSFIVFGKETAGLPESLLEANPEKCVRIPMREHLRSLNLSNSAAIAVYEILRQHNFEGLCNTGEPRSFKWDGWQFKFTFIFMAGAISRLFIIISSTWQRRRMHGIFGLISSYLYICNNAFQLIPPTENFHLSFCFIASFAFVLQMLRTKPIPLILLCIICHNTNG